jgi:hypothetical protein
MLFFLPQDENRFSKLLLRLSPLRSLQSDVIEEIFFSGLIGNVQIHTVIPDLLKMAPIACGKRTNAFILYCRDD